MKKVFIIMVVLSFLAAGLTAGFLMDELPSYFVCNDGYATYSCYLQSTTYWGVNVYTIVVSPYGLGVLLVNTYGGTFQINVFEGYGSWASYCQVGYINKPCATAYNANSFGGMFQTQICIGPAPVGAAETSPNWVNKK
jgi:hypothetical protein